MPKSEAAKELERKNKEQVRLRKAQKKNSDNPADWGMWRQVRFSYSETKKHDPQLPWLMAAAFAGPLLLMVVIALMFVSFANWPWWEIILFAFLGAMLGALLAQWILARRAQASMYKRYEGQPGSAEVALRMLGKDWVTKPVVAANRNYDTVHRAIGPSGLFLIGEGEAGRTKALLAQEVKRHEQVSYGVKVQSLMVGDKPGQVPLAELGKYLKKQPKQLSATQITETSKRLAALDAVRSRMPVPKGPMPTRPPSRRAMRGN